MKMNSILEGARQALAYVESLTKGQAGEGDCVIHFPEVDCEKAQRTERPLRGKGKGRG